MFMHMADALLSPAVGGAMWAASAGSIAWCSSKVRREPDDRKAPLMGVLGAFIFAAQMINFSIPGTGSSGHLGGGLLLTILLGPYAAFLTIASVLVVQALFFADGGLLALGCNIFNLGFFPAFIAYPFIYKKIAGAQPGRMRMTIAAIAAAVAGLQMGAFGVVLETFFSGISDLPFSTFVLLMQPIHLAIGIVEGFVTASVLTFAYRARPEILSLPDMSGPVSARPMRNILIAFSLAALLTGGIVSWFASKNPDGLEWAVAHVTGKEELEAPGRGVHAFLASLQQKIAILPDYSFGKPAETVNNVKTAEVTAATGSSIDAGASLSGMVGGFITLAAAFSIGFVLKRRKSVSC
jgi:cobalt/nickel transport system permease protein